MPSAGRAARVDTKIGINRVKTWQLKVVRGRSDARCFRELPEPEMLSDTVLRKAASLFCMRVFPTLKNLNGRQFRAAGSSRFYDGTPVATNINNHFKQM